MSRAKTHTAGETRARWILAGLGAALIILFLASFLLGRFEVPLPEVLRILVPRYVIGLVFAALCWFLLPVPAVYRQTLVIPLLGPVSSAVPAFTAQLKGDYELSSAINSFSILISIVMIIAALMIIL